MLVHSAEKRDLVGAFCLSSLPKEGPALLPSMGNLGATPPPFPKRHQHNQEVPVYVFLAPDPREFVHCHLQLRCAVKENSTIFLSVSKWCPQRKPHSRQSLKCMAKQNKRIYLDEGKKNGRTVNKGVLFLKKQMINVKLHFHNWVDLSLAKHVETGFSSTSFTATFK